MNVWRNYNCSVLQDDYIKITASLAKFNFTILYSNNLYSYLMRVSGIGFWFCSGTEKYNQGLSERRAQSVKDYLVYEKLFAADKIYIIGYREIRLALHEANPNNVYSKAAKAKLQVLLKIIHK